MRLVALRCVFFFFFNDTATTEIYTLSLHDALPISSRSPVATPWYVATSAGSPRTVVRLPLIARRTSPTEIAVGGDRKSTRLNSSHANISYAVFCLKKKKKPYNAYTS